MHREDTDIGGVFFASKFLEMSCGSRPNVQIERIWFLIHSFQIVDTSVTLKSAGAKTDICEEKDKM